MQSQSHFSHRSRTDDSSSYSDDDSQSYDTSSLFTDDGSRSTDYLTLPGVHVRAKDLDRLIDDYLDTGLSRLIRKGARRYLADADSSKGSSFTTSLDDETEATSVAPSTDGSISHVSRASRASAEEAAARRGADAAVAPVRIDETMLKDQSRSSSLPHRIAAALRKKDKTETVNTAVQQDSTQEPAHAEEETRAEKSTIRVTLKNQKRSTDSSTATTSMTSVSQELNDKTKNEPNENRAPEVDVLQALDPPHIPRVTEAKQVGSSTRDQISSKDQILKDLRSLKSLDECQSSLKSENDSFEMLLQSMEKAAEEVVAARHPLTSKNHKMTQLKPAKLWGSEMALWEKDPTKVEAKTVKARSNRQRVTFADKTQVFGEDLLWQRSLEQLEDADIEEIIHNLSMKNASPEGKKISLRDTLGNLPPSDTGSELDVNFIRIPITPSVMQDHQEAQNLPTKSPRVYQASGAVPKSPLTPLQPKNVGIERRSPQSTSAKKNLSSPSPQDTLTKRADDTILTPQYVPFNSSLERKVSSAPPKVPFAQQEPTDLQQHQNGNDVASSNVKGGLRQRARSKLTQKALSEKEEARDQTKTGIQQKVAPENIMSEPDPSVSENIGQFCCEKVDGGSEVEIFLASSTSEERPHDEDRFSNISQSLKDAGEGHRDETKETSKSKKVTVKQKPEVNSVRKSSIAVAILDQNSNTKAGASDDIPIEPVLTHVRLFDAESKGVQRAKTVKQHSTEHATKEPNDLDTSTVHGSLCPVKINMTGESVELQSGRMISDHHSEKRVPDFSLKRMLSIPDTTLMRHVAKDVAKTPSGRQLGNHNDEIMHNDDKSGTGGPDKEEASQIKSRDSSIQDADSVQVAPQQTASVDEDCQRNLALVPAPASVNNKKSQTAFMRKLRINFNSRAEDVANPDHLDDNTVQVLSKATASVMSGIEVENPDLTSEMTELKGTIETENESNNASLDRSSDIDPPEPKIDILAKPSAIHSVLELFHHVRKNNSNHNESIVNVSGGVEVAIEKSKENVLGVTGRALLDHLRLQLGESKKHKEPPTFEEAYMHLKSKVTPKSTKPHRNTPVKEHLMIPATSDTPKDTPQKSMPKSPAANKSIVKRATGDALIDLPIIGASLCGSEIPSSPVCQNFVIGAALKACGAPARSPVSLDISDENSLIEDAVPSTEPQVDNARQAKEMSRLRKKLGAISQRLLSNKHQSPETSANAEGGLKDSRNDKRTSFLRLTKVRHVNGEPTASQKQTKTDELNNSENERVTSTGDQASAARSKKHRSRSKSQSRSRSSKLSIEEREKKLKIFEHAVERRLEADRALLKAIKAKMATSPHRHQETFLDRLEDRFDVPTMCRGDQIDRTSPSNGVKTLAGAIGGLLACTNSVSALKAQSP